MEKKIANATKKKKASSKRVYIDLLLIREKCLNFLDGGSMIQSSSNLYHAQDMNYLREDYRNVTFWFFKLASAIVFAANSVGVSAIE
ncbi:hypothetical protein Ahy_A05g022319 isoform C [Arachis hypogaea]|uniref:Uncharacterized protein n=1 Tax=Arachis hypogaea TaxID=3818 RepID=A0A445D0M4_ARAHY|nr:hypothetical protein Ahy_A05g022319 isoform C [Arachis hypogaea]